MSQKYELTTIKDIFEKVPVSFPDTVVWEDDRKGEIKTNVKIKVNESA